MCLGVPGKIIEINADDPSIAVVDVSGVRRDVNISCLDDISGDVSLLIGQWVLIHVGFAMSVIDEVQAEQTIAWLAGEETLTADIKATLVDKSDSEQAGD